MTLYRLLILILLLLLPCASGAEQAEGQQPQRYHLAVSFDIANSKITGLAGVAIEAGKEVVLQTGDLRILEVAMNQQTVHFTVINGVLRILPSQSGNLTIRYEGVFKDAGNAGGTNYGVVKNSIGERGISLTDIWYPQPDCLCIYDLKAALPEGYTALSEAESIGKSRKGPLTEFSFDFPHPVPGINFIAAKDYEEIKDVSGPVEVYAYFFREDRELAKSYIEYAKRYLKLYGDMLGRYAYKRFSIVENFLPSGYSMPTYTLLGRDVVRLPFIVETSLGHEVLHQWFGNLVYIDYGTGNWAEGLTTYLADHFYEEQKGKGWEYRKQALVDYADYVNGKNEFPLRAFRGRTDSASKAIGYGKAMLVFHMLKNTVGEDTFSRSLKNFIAENRFRQASWDDIRKAFERESKKDLGWFFKQWVDEPGLPEIYFESFGLKQNGDLFTISLGVAQKGKPFVLDIPLVASSAEGHRKKFVNRLDKEKGGIKVSVGEIPERIAVDEDYDIARKLSANELPPVLARLLGDEKLLLALPVTQKELYKDIIGAFRERGAVEKEAPEIKDSEVKDSSLIIFGNDNPLAARLYGKTEGDAGFSLVVKENPWNPRKVIGIINGKSKEQTDAAFRKIFHYGKYSALYFDNGRNVYKRIDDSQRGIEVEHRAQAAAVDASAVRTLPDVIGKAAGKKIIYIGEYHDKFAHHHVELEGIKGVYKKNKKLAIGMEMFDRPFQKVLDEYISGSIDEKEFLKKSEYFSRWSFDYNLYKPIIDFARTEKIPVIALNIRREIVEKVSRGGIDSLTEEEKKEIPQQMDFSNNKYRERLREIFEKHGGSRERQFDFFYQSQILWDETMSQSIDDFFRKNPDYEKEGQMVVLAGSGHLMYGDGIPKRTFRRNGYDYATILNDVDMEKDIASYLVYPAPIEGTTAPKLMAMLKEDHGKVSIAGFTEGSVSEKAGLKAGDVILALDNVPVSTVNDVRIHLFYKKQNETVKVKVIRKRFILGDKTMDFDVVL